MGRKNATGNKTSTVDRYRQELGRQEKKVTAEHRREIKRLKSEQETVSYWKNIIWMLAAVLFLVFIIYVSLTYFFTPKDSF
ncbi:unnamed protein product [Rotaria magnacalcarata]|uniref:Uncharacterized protein n=1 Tax=Rotaria magnacalcarata TaxID=392030 RepID=A0A816KME0_9BILA|nr:unnamed protein product [Rotaria magnacalcarata]CAF1669475.1 unnamed protein product [Rotaria magnacalcarata]CAF1923127.1 unnamed protein product [Rotaria magnacalcarata]CAF1968567.1 unnamed protein product [Rotaria magnacalcarata]CAF2145780.1 unnamed protein product [Rotaria magnacalcarata]